MANASLDPVQICLGAAYLLAAHQHKPDVAIAGMREAVRNDPDLRLKLQAKRDEYAPVVADPHRPCHIERTMHGLLTEALA